MINRLKRVNQEIEIYSVHDLVFKTYGRVIDLNTKEIIDAAERYEMPEKTKYIPSIEGLEGLDAAKTIQEEYFGTMPIQVGCCYGYNKNLNATEWHTSSEINVAVTDIVLILGHIWDVENNTVSSDVFKAFYIPKGTAVEVFSTTLHYCPCQVNDDGFRCIVVLPKGTNTTLNTAPRDKRVIAKNKWLIAHIDNEEKIKQGAVAGIIGNNYEIMY